MMELNSPTKPLSSGSYYSLAELFQGERKVIIPDLQRDYCWGGTKEAKELVSGFCDSIINTFKEKQTDELTLGMIYAYENPKNHIQLCDGQQRITTLYLLMGLLFKKTKLETLKKCLISDYELLHDDKEPYLQYAIRETTLYFLKDLVVHYFLKDASIIDITKEHWYFKEYDLDPSIQSILLAIKQINEKLATVQETSLPLFCEYILKNIKILYYDLENREKGEDLFVIINTTGEPLTATENMKPLLLGKLKGDVLNKFSKQWEERETFFWKKKDVKEYQSDEGLNDFLNWYAQTKKRNTSIETNKDLSTSDLDDIHLYFENLKKLVCYIENNESIKKLFTFINDIFKKEVSPILALRKLNKEKEQTGYILLPLLHFMVLRSNEENEVYLFLRRLRKNYFDKIREKRKPNAIEWNKILGIIDASNSLEEVLQSPIWHNDEEKIKTQLKVEHKKKIEEWEDHNHFQGDLSPLFKVYRADKDFKFDSNGVFIFEKLEEYYESYLKFLSPTEDFELHNQITLLRLCSDYKPDWFNVKKGYRCLSYDKEIIFIYEWFFPIWHRFTHSDMLKEIGEYNKYVFNAAVLNKHLSENLLFQTKELVITKEDFSAFERERIMNWAWLEKCWILPIIFVFMYFEMLAANEKGEKLEFPYKDLPQLGISLFDFEELDPEYKHTYGNLSIAFHKVGGWYVYVHNLNIVRQFAEIQGDDTILKREKIAKCNNIISDYLTRYFNLE